MKNKIIELERRIELLESVINIKKNYTIYESKSELPKYVHDVVNYILATNNITMEQLLYSCNELNIQLCRHEIHVVLFNLLSIRSNDYVGLQNNRCVNLSLKAIGKITHRTHATVLHSINIIENECFTRKNYRIYFEKLIKDCKEIIIKEINNVENQ